MEGEREREGEVEREREREREGGRGGGGRGGGGGEREREGEGLRGGELVTGEEEKGEGRGRCCWGSRGLCPFERTCEQKPVQTVVPKAWGVYGSCIYDPQIKGSTLLRPPPAASADLEQQIKGLVHLGVMTNYRERLSGPICSHGDAGCG